MRPARLTGERGALFLRPAYDENRPLHFRGAGGPVIEGGCAY